MLAMARMNAWVGRLNGWRRYCFAVLSGVLSALAFAPTHFPPAMAISLICLYWLIQSSHSRRMAFNVAWFWGFGHFLAGNIWIANSFMIDIQRFGWMMPPVISGLAAFLALYAGMTGALAWRHTDLSPGRILVFAALWTIGEWLRSHLLTGYAWNLTAYIWDWNVPMMQSVAFWGSWGLSLVTTAILTLPASLAGYEKKSALYACIGAVSVLALLFVGGLWRLSDDAHSYVPGVKLRLVQANLSQKEKLDGGFREQHFRKHLELTRNTPGLEQITHVIWPESAIPFLIDRDAPLRQLISEIVPRNGALLAGAIRGAPTSGDLERVWNSLVVINAGGEITAKADKAHLVPLGEYVPLRRFLPFLDKLTPGSLDFSAAPGPVTIPVPGAPDIGPSICYEVIFPGAVVDENKRPSWLVNITNDGWFGNSTGPYQHFAAARYRAVEEGIPLVRAANTGISGVVNGYGRIEVQSSLGTVEVIDTELPSVLPPTYFARFGLIIPALFVFLALIPIAQKRRPA